MLKNGNFAYLNWLSRQTKAYWVIIGIFAFLLGVNVYDYWQHTQNQVGAVNEIESGQVIMTAEQEVQPPLPNNTEKIEKTLETTEEEMLAEIVPNLPQEIYVNPLDLAGYQAPCTGKILCDFGVNFDERFGDYRYHQGIVYQLSKDEITASLSGTVTNIYQEDGENVVVIDNNDYRLIYRGLLQLEVAISEQIELGQPIGKAAQILTVEAIEYR